MTDKVNGRTGSMQRVEWEAFAALAHDADTALPVEQTVAWDAFDEAVEDRGHWGRLVYRDAGGTALALLSFSRMRVRGFTYLWAKHGPVWLHGRPTPEQEQDLRDLLVPGLRYHAPDVAFVRLHAWHPAEDLHELLQTMTYDRTVVLDLDHPDDEALLASFAKRGRRDVRKALREAGATYTDETEQAEEVFGELYEILLETAQRDGFRAAPESTYRTMLRAFGPEHARLFVARDAEGAALAWCLDVFWETSGAHYYAASTGEGRRVGAADALLYHAACRLRERGVRTWDLMGAGSERVPELAGVGVFKTKFTTAGAVEVAGAWDVPVRPRLYTALVRALGLKRSLASAVMSLRERARGEREQDAGA